LPSTNDSLLHTKKGWVNGIKKQPTDKCQRAVEILYEIVPKFSQLDNLESKKEGKSSSVLSFSFQLFNQNRQLS